MSPVTFDFTCPKCRYNNKTSSVDEIKLLKTVASSGPKRIEWAIYTCPQCKETFGVPPNSNLYKMSPVTHIALPKYDTK